MSHLELRTGSEAVTTISDEEEAALASRLRGRLVRPTDPDYDDVRAVWNGIVDKRPALIARCEGVSDVMACVRFADQHHILVAVRGGGHNVAGNAVCEDGLVIDLSLMNSVRVDPRAGTVRAEGGVTIGQLDHETQSFGLAVPMGLVSATGIGGLTLGGGLGWLRRKYGLSCDNLLSADVVTADGQLVTASAAEHRDLLWALKGGGGNFGVVTSYEFQAYPVGPDVFFAFLIHSSADTRAALRFFREWAADAPDEVTGISFLWHGPEIPEIPADHHGKAIVVLMALYSGEAAEGERVLRPLRDFGSPIADLSEATRYLDVQRVFDADYPAHEMRYYWKSHHLSSLSDEAIDLLMTLNDASPSPHSTLDLWQLGGSMSRIGAQDTAFGDRSAAYMVGIESNWEHREDDDACIGWARKAFGALEPLSTGQQYVNFPGFYEDGEKMMRQTFGANLDRLAAVKRKYDPTNLFRLNHNVSPADVPMT
jgi:FAD/FMN-containing dehydrogenase